MRVSAYCRVSTDSSDQINSYENQLSYFDREIVTRGHTLYHIYADRGLTGTKLNNRKEFELMLTDAGIDVKVFTDNPKDRRVKKKHTVYELSDREPKFEEIWIKNTSRFARNTLSYEIITLLRQKKVNIFFIEQNINSNDLAQDLLLKLMQIFDEQDSKDKSLKVRSGNLESAVKGVIRTNSKIYGYKYIQSENRLVAIPEEAAVVRTIFELYSQNYGARRIIKELDSRNIKTREGISYCKSTIIRIIKNEKYTGFNNPLKYDTGVVFAKNASPKVKDSYEIVESDRIEPIISVDLFNKCKEVMANNTGDGCIGRYNGVSKYSGKIYCGHCGSIYYANRDKGREFYNCNGKKKNGTKYCSNPNVSEVKINSFIDYLVSGGIHAIIKSRINSFIAFEVSRMKTQMSYFNSDTTNAREAIAEEMSKVQNRLDGFYELYANSRSNKDVLQERINKEELELDSIKTKLYECAIGNDQIIEGLKESSTKIKQMIDMSMQRHKYTHKEILDMIDRILIQSKNGVTIIYPEITNVKGIRPADVEINDAEMSGGIDFDEVDRILTMCNSIIEGGGM